MFDRGDGDLWRQISETITDEISRGVLPPGQRLPASTALAARFGVHQHTVLKAVSHLQAEGVLRVERGRGTFVAERPIAFQIGARTWFEQNLLESNHAPARRVLSVVEMAAPHALAETLRIQPGDALCVVTLLGEADGVPIYLGRDHFPVERLPGIGDYFRSFGSEPTDRIVFSSLFRQFGVDDFRRRDVRVRARPPSTSEVHHLRMTMNVPILETIVTLVDRVDRPLAQGLAAYCSDRVELAMSL